MRVGLRILEVNGQSLLGSTHQEAVRALRSVGDRLVVMVCDGFDPASLDEPSPDTPSSPLGYIPQMRKDSTTNIDKDDAEHLLIKKVVNKYVVLVRIKILSVLCSIHLEISKYSKSICSSVY